MADIPQPQRPPPPSRQPEPSTVELPAAAEASEAPTVGLPRQATPTDGSSRPASALPASETTRPFGDYELLGEIQRGGMGVVYRARERYSGRLVALKMMLDETVFGEADLRRFVLEARATAELHHPGIVAIHAWGEHEGHPFYTMDFVSGVPLSRLLQAGPLPVERAVRYLSGIAGAVAAAHEQGIVHRDLKPSNIMIDAADQPRVLDFGLAKRHRSPSKGQEATDEPGHEVHELARSPSPPASPPATEKGAILGTPAYMAPEQARGEHHKVSPATDVHALGAICYEMVTGRTPFQAESTMETLMQVADHTPAPMRQHDARVPAELDAVCARCLAKDAADRYPDAGTLAADLEAYWRGAAQGRRFASLAASASVLVLLLQLLQLLVPGPTEVNQGLLSRLAVGTAAACGPATQEAALVLAALAAIFLFHLLPALAWLALVVWLGAWAWYSGRGVWVGLAGVVLSPMLWIAWPALGGSLLFPALFSAAALTALAVPALRYFTGDSAAHAERTAQGSDPYLQRLFAVRGERAPKATLWAQQRAVKLADVEPGKTLLRGARCLLRWGRQISLDRAVLVWFDTTPVPVGSPAPGVLVRHPQVLALHAVGPAPEGRFLVTEPAAAAPLAEFLERRPLTVREAVVLAVRIARTLQAFHEQGVCHGRLSPEWILVRGDCEPLLCPCGVPSQSEEDRRQDIQELARLLLSWLPPRSPRWQGQSLAVLYRVCDAAVEGSYARPAELAADLESADQIAQARSHERLTNTVAAALYAAALLVAAIVLFGGRAGLAISPGLSQFVAEHLLLAFAPGIAVFGYGHARTVVHRLRHPLHIAARSPWLGQRTRHALAMVALLAAIPAGFAWFVSPPEQGWAVDVWSIAVGLAVMGGYWGLGVLFAGARSFGEVLFGSLRELRSEQRGVQTAEVERDSPDSGFAG